MTSIKSSNTKGRDVPDGAPRFCYVTGKPFQAPGKYHAGIIQAWCLHDFCTIRAPPITGTLLLVPYYWLLVTGNGEPPPPPPPKRTGHPHGRSVLSSAKTYSMMFSGWQRKATQIRDMTSVLTDWPFASLAIVGHDRFALSARSPFFNPLRRSKSNSL